MEGGPQTKKCIAQRVEDIALRLIPYETLLATGKAAIKINGGGRTHSVQEEICSAEKFMAVRISCSRPGAEPFVYRNPVCRPHPVRSES